MASSLSEFKVASIYDAGHLAFSVQGAEKSSLAAKTDLRALLDQENSEELIQALTPLTAYRALVAADDEVRLEAVEKLSSEQVTGLLDFDAWKEDRLDAKNAFRWLKIFGEVGTEQLYTRFSQLEEEYQLALLCPYIRVYDQAEFDKMSDVQQDSLNTIPGSEFYYAILTTDPDIYQGIEDLIESTMAHNMSYTLSLLAHAAYVPPTEQEALVAQFRKGRIEDEGFVSYEESLSSFFAIDLEDKINQWRRPFRTDGVIPFRSLEGRGGFLAQVLAYGQSEKWGAGEISRLNSGFIFVANNLCAASQVETDDEAGLQMIVAQVKALSGLALEVLSDGDLERAATILMEEHPKILFRFAVTLVDRVRTHVLKIFHDCGLPESLAVGELIACGKFGQALEAVDINWLDSLGLQNVEFLKGLFNRYPLRPITRDGNLSANTYISFAMIDSVQALLDLQNSLDLSFGILGLMQEGQPLRLHSSFDKSLNTAIIQALITGQFTSHGLTREQIEEFVASKFDSNSTVVETFLDSLRTQLANDDRWSAHSATNQFIYGRGHDSVEGVLALMRAKVGQVIALGEALQLASERDIKLLVHLRPTPVN